MEWIIDNWYILLAIVTLLISIGVIVYEFFGLPRGEQLRKIKELILYWVTLAEKEFGSGTGVLKLRYVYDLFTTKYPIISKLISFERFSEWVKEALIDMEEILSKNKAVQEIVTGQTK